MSLIDEALKRAQEAGERKDGAVRERPWVPAPLPDPAIARRARLRRALGLAAVALLVLAGGFWLLRQRAAFRAAAPGRSTELPAAIPSPIPAPPTLVAVEVAPPPSVPARPTRVSRPTPEAAAIEAAPAETSARAAPPVSPPRGRVHQGFVVLPGGARIELGGIAWSETEPRALVNDRIVSVGSYVEGYTLTRIEEDRITLEKDGAILVVSVK